MAWSDVTISWVDLHALSLTLWSNLISRFLPSMIEDDHNVRGEVCNGIKFPLCSIQLLYGQSRSEMSTPDPGL